MNQMNDDALTYQRDLLTIAIERYERSNDGLSIEHYYRAKTERNKIRVEIARRYLEKRREEKARKVSMGVNSNDYQ